MISPLKRVANSTASYLHPSVTDTLSNRTPGAYYLGLAGARGTDDCYEGFHRASEKGKTPEETAHGMKSQNNITILILKPHGSRHATR